MGVLVDYINIAELRSQLTAVYDITNNYSFLKTVPSPLNPSGERPGTEAISIKLFWFESKKRVEKVKLIEMTWLHTVDAFTSPISAGF